MNYDSGFWAFIVVCLGLMLWSSFQHSDRAIPRPKRRFLINDMRCTVGSAFDAAQNNFDTLRLLAALTVIVSHSYPLTGTRFEPFIAYLGGYDTGGGIAVAIFFIISGFLITRSVIQRDFLTYFMSRVARIVPGLAGLVLLDVLVIGPLFTQLSLHAYFANPETWRHLGSISVFVQNMFLPGVFRSNPDHGVAGQIWTLPLEFACYLALPFLLAIGFLRRWLVLVVVALMAALYVAANLRGLSSDHQGPDIIISGLPLFSTVKNALFFMLGSAIWLHREDISLNLGPVDKVDSQTGRTVIQDCFWGGSLGARRSIERPVESDWGVVAP